MMPKQKYQCQKWHPSNGCLKLRQTIHSTKDRATVTSYWLWAHKVFRKVFTQVKEHMIRGVFILIDFYAIGSFFATRRVCPCWSLKIMQLYSYFPFFRPQTHHLYIQKHINLKKPQRQHSFSRYRIHKLGCSCWPAAQQGDDNSPWAFYSWRVKTSISTLAQEQKKPKHKVKPEILS